MTWEHLHLIAHSFPIVLSMSATLVGAFGWATHRPELERWALLALAIAGVFVVPAYVTGLSAADVASERTFTSPGAIQSHRIAATWAMVPVLACGVLAGFALYEREDARLRRFVLCVAIVATAGLIWTAVHGAAITPSDPTGTTRHEAPSDAWNESAGEAAPGRSAASLDDSREGVRRWKRSDAMPASPRRSRSESPSEAGSSPA